MSNKWYLRALSLVLAFLLAFIAVPLSFAQAGDDSLKPNIGNTPFMENRVIVTLAGGTGMRFMSPDLGVAVSETRLLNPSSEFTGELSLADFNAYVAGTSYASPPISLTGGNNDWWLRSPDHTDQSLTARQRR